METVAGKTLHKHRHRHTHTQHREEEIRRGKGRSGLTGPAPHSVALTVSALEPHSTDPAAPHTDAGRVNEACKSASSSKEIHGVTSPGPMNQMITVNSVQLTRACFV